MNRQQLKSHLIMGLAGALLAVLDPRAAHAAATSNSSNSLDYSAFRIISERNIFNSRRSARYVPSSNSRTRSRSESFALVGTLSSDKGTVAFFDGSRSDYKKVLKPEETIAGFKIAAIESSFVKLASATNEIQLRVGMQLRREEQGEWQLSERPEVLEPVVSHTTYSRGSYSQTPAATPGEPQPPAEAQLPIEGAPPGFEGGPAVGFMIDPQTGQTNLVAPIVEPVPADAAGAAPPSAGGDVLDYLRRRAAASRGDGP